MRPYINILLFIFAFIIQQTAFSQKAWDKTVLEKANTAKGIAYLTEEEEAIIFYSNLLRLDPVLFKNTYVKHYIDSTGSNSKFVKSLLKTLESTKSMQALTPSKSLYTIAKDHAIDFGKQGKTGHGNFKKRFQKYFNNCECTVGENCYYGRAKPLDIVIGLLIDEGINDLSHRKNLLNPEYKNIGVYIGPHKVFKKSCVADFSSASTNE